MTKSARRKRREAEALERAKPEAPKKSYSLVEMKLVTYRPFEKHNGDIGWAELGFPCCRITIMNNLTGQMTHIGYSNKSGHLFTVKTPHGIVYQYGKARFDTYCQERYGFGSISDCIIDFAN